MIIERLKGFWRDDLELEHRQVIIRNAIEQIEDLREALALEQKTAGAEIEKLRLELDMQQATILVPSQKDDRHQIKRLNSALVEALDEAAQLRRAFHDIYEVYAGCDELLVETSRAYLEQLLKEMADIAAEHKKAP